MKEKKPSRTRKAGAKEQINRTNASTAFAFTSITSSVPLFLVSGGCRRPFSAVRPVGYGRPRLVHSRAGGVRRLSARSRLRGF